MMSVYVIYINIHIVVDIIWHILFDKIMPVIVNSLRPDDAYMRQ